MKYLKNNTQYHPYKYASENYEIDNQRAYNLCLRFAHPPLASSIQLASAQRGEKLFNQNCYRCHGIYEKNWSLPDAETLPLTEKLKTSRVRYSSDTKVLDVGTEQDDFEGKAPLADQLNKLALSKKWGLKVKAQRGYVPPPLEGVWARFPYFHNASAPTLCAVLTPAHKRPGVFWVGRPDDPERHFDSRCVGYPVGDKTPSEWMKDPYSRHDGSILGMRQQGHTFMLVDDQGEELYSEADKLDLVEYMKTL